MNNLSNQIKAEIGRIVAGAKVDFDMKKSSQQSMEASLEELKEKAAKANEASIKMHEFDAEVQANKDVYQAFLSRAKEAAAQIEMQTPDSRVIAMATAPIDIDFPKRSLVLAMGLVGGMVAGVGFVIARDAFAGGFRRAEELETVFGMHTLARIPMAGPDRRSLPLLRPVQLASGAQSRELVGVHSKAQKFARVVLDRPDSPFSESIQSLRIALRRAAIVHGVRTVLVTSALPDEGKSTVCINLARASATEGVRTLLIDADLREQSVAAAIGLTEPCGLADYLTGRRDIAVALPKDKDSGLFVISGPRRFDSFQALKLLSSQQLGDLLAQARNMFDLVLIDAPPLLPVADSRVLMDVVDGTVLVVAAGQTGREALSAALHETPGLDEKLLGVALNKMTADFDRYYGRMAG
jgi:polysaccharide biosynthesis transport protein